MNIVRFGLLITAQTLRVVVFYILAILAILMFMGSLLLLLIPSRSAWAKDIVGDLVRQNKKAEVEYITSYNEGQAIKSAKQLIKKYKGKKIEPSLRHRLADLYIRKSKTKNFLDQTLKKKGKDFTVDFNLTSNKEKWIKKSIFELEIVRKKNPSYNKIDQVLYTLGISYFKLNKADQAKNPLLKLVHKHSKSHLLQDTHLLLAEIYYRDRNFKKSHFYFTEIINSSNHKTRTYVLYKRAWTRYHREKFLDAFHDIKKAYLAHRDEKVSLDLSNEILKDLPLFMAEVFKGKEIYSQVSKFIKKRELVYQILDSQAQVFEKRADYKDEVEVLNGLLSMTRDKVKLFELYDRLARAYEHKSHWSSMAKYYKKADFLLDKKISRKIEGDLKHKFLVFGRNLVKQRYKEWIYKKKADHWKKNKKHTQAILYIGDLAQKRISESSEKSKILNILAEIHFRMGSFEVASHYYESSSDLSKNYKKAHELLYSAIEANEKSVPKDRWKTHQVLRQRSLVIKKYDKKFRNEKYLLEVLYKMARVEEKFGESKLALKIFKRLGDEFSNSIKGQESQDFVIQIFEKQKKYSLVNSYLRKIIPKTRDNHRQNKLRSIYDRSFFVMAEHNEKNKKYKEAVKNYKDYISKSYLKQMLKEAYWNIPIAYKKAGLKSKAAESFVTYYHHYKGDKNAKKSLQEAFSIYEKTRNYKKLDHVAGLMEQISKGLEKDELSFSRARISLKLKEFKKAERRFYALIKLRNKTIRHQAHQFLFSYVDKKNSKFRNSALKILKGGDEPFSSESFLRGGEEFLKKKKTSLARAQFLKVLNSKKAFNESKAQAAILIAEMDVESLKLNLPNRPMSANKTVKYIERMMSRVRPNIDQIQAVLNFKHSESSLRALIKLSRLYVDLSILFKSIRVSDRSQLKISTEREIRNLLSTTKSSYYQSYSSALNIISQDKKFKRKYSSRLRKIKKDYEKFYKTQKIVMRGSK